MALRPLPDQSTQPQALPAGAVVLPLFSLRYWVVYGLGLAAFMALFASGLFWFRSALDAYQMELPRYAAERAIHALDQGDKDKARQEIDTVLEDAPVHQTGAGEVWEGQVIRNRVSTLEQLTGKLLAAGLPDRAEAVGWKMILEFHLASRILEHIDLWEWMVHVKTANQDWSSAFEILKILGAHGVNRVREPGEIEPDPIPVKSASGRLVAANLPADLPAILTRYYQAGSPDDYLDLANQLRMSRARFRNPNVRRKLDSLIHTSLIKANHPVEAHTFFGSVWGRNPDLMNTFWRDWPRRQGTMNLLDRDPSMLGMMWRDRPSSATQTISDFLDSFRGDPRVDIVNFKNLNPKDIGYFNPENKIFHLREYASLSQSVAASMPVQISRSVNRVYIAYEGYSALGVAPILLVRINDGPYMPVYCDSDRPDLAYIDVKLDGPARYNFEFAYINDAAFQFQRRGTLENRDLHLFGMALVQVPQGQ